MRARRSLFVFGLASALAIGAGACGSCGSQQASTEDAAEPLPAAPEKLIADITIGTPNTSWGKLQRGIGGAVGILPAAAGGIICAAFGIDPSFGQEIDGVAPGFAALAGDPAEPAWAFAVKLVDPRRARLLLSDDTGKFNAKESDAKGAGYTELVPKSDAGTGPSGALALSKSGYLVIARRAADLPHFAGYVSRTMPSRTLPEGAIVVDVSRRAIVEVLAPKVDALWTEGKAFLVDQDERLRREHGGRAPDYGDPKAIVAALDGLVTQRLAVMKDLDRLRVVLDIGDDDAVLTATLTPAAASAGAAASWISAMSTGDAADVLAMPGASAVALTTRDSEAARARQADDLEKALTSSFAGRIGESDAKKIHDVTADVTKARGEVFGMSLGWDEPRVVFLRGAVRDEEAARRAIKSAIDLARAAPFKDLLRVKDIALETKDVAPLGKIEIATITRATSDAGPPPILRSALRDAGAPRPTGIAWAFPPKEIDLASAENPAAALESAAKPPRTLADEPSVMRAVTPLGKDASTIVIAQPLRFDPRRANLPVTPLVFAVGRKDKSAFVRLDVGDALLRELTRSLMGM